jgi:hypothetical protein
VHYSCVRNIYHCLCDRANSFVHWISWHSNREVRRPCLRYCVSASVWPTLGEYSRNLDPDRWDFWNSCWGFNSNPKRYACCLCKRRLLFSTLRKLEAHWLRNISPLVIKGLLSQYWGGLLRYLSLVSQVCDINRCRSLLEHNCPFLPRPTISLCVDIRVIIASYEVPKIYVLDTDSAPSLRCNLPFLPSTNRPSLKKVWKIPTTISVDIAPEVVRLNTVRPIRIL